MDDSRTQLEKVRTQFTRQADAYLRMRQTTDATGLRGLVLLSGVQPDHRVLDIACGPGFLTMTFAEHCARAVGVDATGVFLSRARAEAEQRGQRNLEFCMGDVEHLPYASNAFDTLACRAAFHHFLHPRRVLAEAIRVMHPAGRLVIADMLTSEDAAQAAYHNRIERLCDPTHVRALAESEFERLFHAAGLDVVLRYKTPLDYDVDEWIDHGGPSPESAREIVSLLAASIDIDRSGLHVRRENGALRFSHTGIVFVLTRRTD